MKLDVRDLRFSYRGASEEVLRGVEFCAKPGDVIALLGPNGVGKSTLFRCLLGFIRTWDGAIEFDGADLRGMSRRELAHAVAYVPQGTSQVFDYTLKELVLMGLTNQIGRVSTPKPAHEACALEALEGMGIAHLANRGCREVSGGQRQLALLARALVQDARILVMDEPTANLDYGNQYRVAEHVARLGDQGYTVIMSTHDPNQAILHANRAIVMEEGRIVADGAPSACLTEQLLSRLYGIQVGLGRGIYGGEPISFCLPAGYLEEDLP